MAVGAGLSLECVCALLPLGPFVGKGTKLYHQGHRTPEVFAFLCLFHDVISSPWSCTVL